MDHPHIRYVKCVYGNDSRTNDPDADILFERNGTYGPEHRINAHVRHALPNLPSAKPVSITDTPDYLKLVQKWTA
jgi:hypothetical protein